MKKIAIGLLIAAMTFAVVGCGEKEKTKDTTTKPAVEETVSTDEAKVIDSFTNKYEDQSTGLTFSMPAEWREIDVQGVAVAYLIDELGSNVNLVKEANQGYSLANYNDAAMNAVKTYLNVDEINTIDEKLGKYDVKINEYYSDKEMKLKVNQIVLIEGDYAYVFTLTSTEDKIASYEDTVKDVVSTVDFK